MDEDDHCRPGGSVARKCRPSLPIERLGSLPRPPPPPRKKSDSHPDRYSNACAFGKQVCAEPQRPARQLLDRFIAGAPLARGNRRPAHTFSRCLPLLLLAVCISGCNNGDVVVPASCLPGERPEVKGEPAAVNTLNVYLDVSQSSTNFGRAGGDTPYRDLIAWLLGLRSDFAEASLYGFADRISPANESTYEQAARGTVNPCPSCGFSESRLNDVLAEVASAEPHASLDLVLTDLWLENTEGIGSGRLALHRAIRDILAGGRAIGVLGVAAPYAEQIFDMPGGRDGRARTLPAGSVLERPFFALLIGPPDQVLDLEQRMAKEVFFNGGDADRVTRHFSLFTPTLEVGVGSVHVLSPRSAAVRRSFVLAIDSDDVPGFEINREAIPLAEAGGMRAPDLSAEIFGDKGLTALPLDLEVRSEAWMLVPPEPGAACDPNAWLPEDIGESLVVTEGKTGPVIGLNASAPSLFVLRPGDITFVRYRIIAAASGPGGAPPTWFDEWGFRSEDATALVSAPPALFPSLNLGELGRVLQSAVADHATGEVVAHGAFLLSVK